MKFKKGDYVVLSNPMPEVEHMRNRVARIRYVHRNVISVLDGFGNYQDWYINEIALAPEILLIMNGIKIDD